MSRSTSQHLPTALGCLLLGVLVFSMFPWLTVGAAPADPEINRLIQQLGSNKFTARETASQRLESAGEDALEALRKAAIGSDDPEVRRRAEELIEAIEGRLLLRTPRRFESHENSYKELYSVAFSPDGRLALSAGDRGILLWDVETGKELRRFTGHSKSATSVAFSPDGRQLVSGSEDKTVRLWDAADGRELHCCAGHTGWSRAWPSLRAVAASSRAATTRRCASGTRAPARSCAACPGTRVPSGVLRSPPTAAEPSPAPARSTRRSSRWTARPASGTSKPAASCAASRGTVPV